MNTYTERYLIKLGFKCLEIYGKYEGCENEKAYAITGKVFLEEIKKLLIEYREGGK